MKSTAAPKVSQALIDAAQSSNFKTAVEAQRQIRVIYNQANFKHKCAVQNQIKAVSQALYETIWVGI